jgi:hypothetical protein
VTPQQLIDNAGRLAEMGVTDLTHALEAPEDASHAHYIEALERFGEEVLPRVSGL